jgi:antirestriction protein ArdC
MKKTAAPAKKAAAKAAPTTPRPDVYERMNDLIMERLNGGEIPWKKPWNDYGAPRNYRSGHVYQGINALLLNMLRFEQPFFLTYKQAQDLGGQVRAKEKGMLIIYAGGGVNEDKETGDKKKFSFLRHSTVFNIEQIDGIEWKLPAKPERELIPNEAAELVCANYLANGGPALVFEGAEALYRKSKDMVVMPDRQAFHSEPEYYATLFHEFGHSTGHAKRLNRPELVENAGFGTATYAREELTAELTAFFVSGAVGLDISATVENTTAYLQNKPLIKTAASLAQKAANLIRGVQPEPYQRTEDE